MNRDVRVQSQLERLLAETPISRAPDRLRGDIASVTSRKRQRPPWLTSLKEPPMRYRSQLVVGSPTLRLAAVVAVSAVLMLALAGAVIAGASLLPSPVPVPPVAPTWVTGDVQPAPSCSEPPPVADGDVLRSRDVECSPQTWTSSDPRLTGEVSRRWNWDTYQTDKGSISVGMDAAFLRNDGGGWACSTSYLETGAAVSAEDLLGVTFTCVEDGGYAGLSAVLDLMPAGGNAEEFVGLIFSGELAPPPEAPAAQ
jgi:hypothetical protein